MPCIFTSSSSLHAPRALRSGAAGRRANTLVLVTAILVLLVIMATAFLVRSQSVRAQAGAQNRAAGQQDRTEGVVDAVTREIADSLFVRPVDQSSYPVQVNANAAAGVIGWQVNIPRSDYPRLPPDNLAIRYGVDYFDAINNANLNAGSDGYLDGFNYAPFSVTPFTNWPDVYAQVSADGTVHGEGNPVGNPGFGDTRWLRSTEPVRALIMAQAPLPSVAVPPSPPNPQTAAMALSNDWGNLALNNGVPVLSPEGLGFSHWAHLSWIPTAENGFRVCYDISDVEAYTLTGRPGTPQGLNALGVPYEQWLTHIPPREPLLTGKDSRGYLVLDRNAWITRRNNWFTDYANVILNSPLDALPNFLRFGAFGDPSDEFKYDPTTGQVTSRGLIARTFADADGDGFTDSFWYLAPASSDRDTRQLVAVSITDNTALLNVNVATRFERTNTDGRTPSDVALVERAASLDSTQYPLNAAVNSGGTAFADALNDDVAVGFLTARENDPESRVTRTNPNLALPLNRVIYATEANGTSPTAGVDVRFNMERWEGARGFELSPSVDGVSGRQPGFLQSIGLMRPGTATGTPVQTAQRPLDLFTPSFSINLPAPNANLDTYGGWFLLTNPNDRLTYFKTQANGGVLVDPVTTSPLAKLTPFGVDDEIELRAFSGLNHAPIISRLEAALGTGNAVDSGVLGNDFLRSSRSREESVRYLVGFPGAEASDPRNIDWRAQEAWNGPNPNVASRGAAELVMDHRRKLTTVNGARNEMLPPRLWTIVDPTAPNDLTRVRPAYIKRGVDFDHDGNPDDINGDGIVNAADDVPPYDPRIVYYNTTPRGDGNGDGRVDYLDALLAREEFMRRNRKIDLRRPTDPAVNGVPASAATIAQNERTFRQDIQRLMRRALIDEDTRGSYFLKGSPDSASQQEINQALMATKFMAASFAANVGSYRDGPRQVTNNLYLDGPVHPDDASQLPADAIPDPQYSDARFIGVEKQPFIQEVFLAFVYPKASLTQAELDAVTGPEGTPNAGCPDAANCQLSDPHTLPPCTANGAGEHFVVYDPADPSTWPAVVFVAQVANPYNTPVKLSEYELRINPASGAPQRFFFGVAETGAIPPNGCGNTYGADVELGPCTPEEPRTAIVFSVPETFPNGDPFPRDAWLDFLDIREPITETNPGNDTDAGMPFPPDNNAIFAPAWGTAAQHLNNKRGGTLFFDATRKVTYPLGLDTGTGGMARWQPATSSGGTPPTGFIELRRMVYRATGGAPTWVVVDRLDNELDQEAGDQNFRDQAARLFTQEHIPPLPEIECRMGKLSINGIRIREDDYYVTWVRGARQWLFDTQNNVMPVPPATDVPGKGIITLDERTPRYAFSRLTGVARTSKVQSDAYVGGVQQSYKGDTWAETDVPDGNSITGVAPWIVMNYYNLWGEAKRGKPTFLPTRIYENTNGPDRRYDYPAWIPNSLPSGTALSYGEKGVTDAKFVDGTNDDNFVAPYRFYQKDDDFTQVAEILDVPLWGPLVRAGGSGGCYATLSEILAQPADSTATLKFPKAPAEANLAYWNRLQIDSARYDTVPGPGGRPNLLAGVPVVPSPVGFISPQQAGLTLLDAFTVDDRGAMPLDADGDGTITFLERALAENRRLRLAQGYEGKATPGLINVNTAPVEVMRAMPQMTRLVYNDDREPHTRARMHVRNQTGTNAAGHINETPAERGVAFDYGAPAPRVRVPEAIDLWRNKGNVTPALGSTVVDPSMPSYFTRGLDLPDNFNNLEIAPGLRQERGIDSLGELALLTQGARFANPTLPAAGDVGDSWNQAAGWSVRYAGLDPYRVRYSEPVTGVGIYSNWEPTGNNPARLIDGIPGPVGSGIGLHEGAQTFPLSARTGTDPQMLVVATVDRDGSVNGTPTGQLPAGATNDDRGAPWSYRYDHTAGDALQQNVLLKGISNIATVRSDVFTVHLKVRTIRRNPITGRWDATDPDCILDDSRYVMGVDRSKVDRPGEQPEILYFTKVPN